MASLNKVQLIGNLGRDPELRYTQGGQGNVTVSMATSRSYKKNEEWQEETEWHNLVIWGEKSERFVEQIRKGSKIYVEGYLKTRSWDDKELKDAKGAPLKHYKTEIVVDRYINLTGRDENTESGQFQAPASSYGTPSAPSRQQPQPGEFDDLPF